jgi:hypothetical protein
VDWHSLAAHHARRKIVIEKQTLVTLRVDIDPEALKQVVEEGRLTKFVDAFPGLLAGHIKAQIVEQLAAGQFSIVFEGRYLRDDFGNDGDGPLPWADVGLPGSRLHQLGY